MYLSQPLSPDTISVCYKIYLFFVGFYCRPVQTQVVEKGTDPKSVVCAFFKAGQCGKGNRCKFSHDLSVERKVEKRSLYVDMRDDDEEDTMDTWNDEKLKEVVDKKHGAEKRMPTTDIVSTIHECNVSKTLIINLTDFFSF